MTRARIIAAVVPLALSSCASIVSAPDETFTIDSKPTGANVTITNLPGTTVYSGITPLTVKLPKSGGYFNGLEYTILFQQDGYVPQIRRVTPHPSAWFLFGNLALGGVIGWLIVDPITGAMWTFDETEINTSLVPIPPRSTSRQDEIQPALVVLTVDQVPKERRTHLVPLAPS
ncbi:hypothetical protein [Marinivivus vitaminiproducens]|uniref:hypothetical protein n=1 Tax=Marinivivus vitaminiproducens TaxID=3035935 RepID=UPI002799370A|nr:hypothetical protein P4R82_24310 [Geminicoccaceae bacterium SCSIO 64248]